MCQGGGQMRSCIPTGTWWCQKDSLSTSTHPQWLIQPMQRVLTRTFERQSFRAREDSALDVHPNNGEGLRVHKDRSKYILYHILCAVLSWQPQFCCGSWSRMARFSYLTTTHRLVCVWLTYDAHNDASRFHHEGNTWPVGITLACTLPNFRRWVCGRVWRVDRARLLS